jgi:preprotein translocase subunit SecA
MDYLREGIGLRAMAQRDPLVEYQREGGDMFNLMMEAFMEEVVGFVFHLEVEVHQTPTVGWYRLLMVRLSRSESAAETAAVETVMIVPPSGGIRT